MRDKRYSSQNQKSDGKNQKKTLIFLSSLVILLTMIVFAMGAALITLYLKQRETQQVNINENSHPSPEAIAIPSPEKTMTPSPEVTITPTPEAEKTPETVNTPESNITPTPEATTAAASPKPTVVNAKSFEYQGLVFELQECKKLNSNAQVQSIRCSVLMTSTQENVKVFLFSNKNESRRSRIFEEGQESLAQTIKFGSDVSRWGSTSNNLIKDVPIKAIFIFEKVPLQTNEIDVFEVSSSLRSSYYNDDIKVEFRNVIVSDS